ncbi:MAG: PEP-CTERM sorting domain-containing protein [Acidobacteriota bacterium]|nr:PEP-CTERM sorting domain-containing protein [Acidobacteriota bacterium]
MLKVVLALLLGTAASGWAGTFLAFDQTSVTVATGDSFTLNALLIDLPGVDPLGMPTPPAQVAGFSFDIAFDPTLLEVVAAPVELGYFAANGCCFSPGALDSVNGVISGIGDVDPIFGGENVSDGLVQFQFMAIAAGTGQITFQNPGLTDPNGNPVTVDGISAAAVTSATPSVPEPATWALTALGVAILLARNLFRPAPLHRRL